ncbi:MAG: type I restriction endonuclease subunit M, partial [Candidatus Magasanikbacteria bacterium CG10_big_fil_rev_8_21_14_0_10_43_9]
MFEQAFKNIDNTLRNDAGVSNELDYVEQTSWMLFLKYLDDLDDEKAKEASLGGKKFTPLFSEEYRWDVWAVPKKPNGDIDHQAMMTGDDLKDFVDHKLFPYLKKFKASTEDSDTLEYKIGEIFHEIRNKVQSGYNLR